MNTSDPSSTEQPEPAEVAQGIGPLFTPPYVYVMFPIVLVVAVIIVPLLPFGGGGGPFAMVVPLTLLGALAMLGAVGSLWPMRLFIGNDGVDVSWFLLHTYISYRDLAEVGVHRSARSRGILFVTRKGRRIPVPMQMHVISVGPKDENLEHITSLIDRIGQHAIPIATRVNFEAAGGSPDQPVDPGEKDAMAVVQDVGERWELRAAAVESLGPLDEGSRDRLRRLAMVTAHRKLQRVLEDAGDDGLSSVAPR